MKTKLIALLLMAAIALGLFAGCTKAPAGPAPETENTPASAATNNNETAGSETNEPTAAPAAFSLPLVSEPATLTVWRTWSADGVNISGPDQIAANQWLEQTTGVTIDWTAAPMAMAAEQFGLMIASQDYCDIITCNEQDYIGGTDKAIEDGVYIDAAPYLSLMPNYTRWREDTPDIHKETATDGGHVLIAGILDGPLFLWNGPMIYQDWADELGYSKVETVDDLYNYLSDVKNVKGVAEGLLVDLRNEKGYYSLCSAFQTCYDFLQVDGKVQFAPAGENFRNMLEHLARWYGEDLIAKDTITQTEFDTAMQRYGAGQLAYMCNAYYGYANMLPMFTGVGGNFLPSPFLHLEENGGKNHLCFRLDRVWLSSSAYVTTAAVERGTAELAFRWLDARFSNECYLALCMGLPGVDWDFDENGDPMYTEDYLARAAEQQMYGFERADRGPACLDYHLRDYMSQKVQGTEWIIDACAVWDESTDSAWIMPPTALTNEEATIYSRYFTDIQTYLDEFVLQVITGTTVLDDQAWDAFTSQLSAMHIDECVAIQQAALDRYNAR